MFSELVDDICVMIGRSNARTKSNVIKYARMTMRECQLLDYFSDDLIEDQLTASSTPYAWDKPANLRELRTVRYDNRIDEGRWPELRRPGKVQKDKVYFYYAGSTYFMFAGVEAGDLISIAYYNYFPYLRYYDDASARPAVFDRAAGEWTYHADYDDNDTLKAEARLLVGNWMLENWAELIQEGTLAKTYKMLREERMAASSFSVYKGLQGTLRTGETSESQGI